MTTPKAGPIAQRVLLFSGGLDSVCYAQLLKPDVLLYVPSGAAYQQKEDDALEAVAAAVPGRLVIMRDAVDMRTLARADSVVPGRNAMLVMLASHHGDTIWLGRAASDRQADSGAAFRIAMTTLLDILWSDQFWCTARTFTVDTPLSHLSKTELVRRFIADGGKPETLLRSVSCYDPEPGHCGVCKPCLHKRWALARAGVDTPPGYWRHRVTDAPWTDMMRTALDPSVWRG